MVWTFLDGEMSKTSEFGRTLDKYLLKLAPLVGTRRHFGPCRMNKSLGLNLLIGLPFCRCYFSGLEVVCQEINNRRGWESVFILARLSNRLLHGLCPDPQGLRTEIELRHEREPRSSINKCCMFTSMPSGFLFVEG